MLDCLRCPSLSLMSRRCADHMLPGPLPGVDCPVLPRTGPGGGTRPGTDIAHRQPGLTAPVALVGWSRPSISHKHCPHVTWKFNWKICSKYFIFSFSCLIGQVADSDLAACLPTAGGALWWEPETARGSLGRGRAPQSSRHQPSVLQVTSYSPDLLIHISSHTWILCFTCTR